MPREQIFMGVSTAALCVIGLWRHRWLLDETGKGRALVRRFGDVGAVRLLFALLAAAFLFGVLLAVGVINPIRWTATGSNDSGVESWGAIPVRQLRSGNVA